MAQALTAYDHITQNNRKTFALVLLFPLILLALVWLACLIALLFIDDRDFTLTGISLLPNTFQTQTPSIIRAAFGFTWGFALPTFILAFIWMSISYTFGDKMMMAFAEARPLKKPDNPIVYNLVENTAMMAGLPCPKIYLIDDDSLNAFATGKSPQKAAIALTTGIVKKLKPLELQGVIAHELGHIGNRDIRLNMLIITGLGVFAFIGEFLLRSQFRSGSKKNKGSGQLAILILFISFALMLFHYFIAPFIQLAISRSREYAADATGAKIIHNPAALADALEKISTDSRVEVLDKQKTMAVACIASPLKANNLTSTHPPIEDRIRRLRAM